VSFTTVSAATLAAGPGPHPAASAYDKGVGEALGVSAFGLYQVELPAGAVTVEHDHIEDRAEDVYAVLRGRGAVLVDGHEVLIGPGQFVAVTPESTRFVRAGADGLTFFAVCAAARGGDPVTAR